MPQLSIGMPTFEDFHGVAFTLQSLRLMGEETRDVEFLVVDNSPNSPHGKETRAICESAGAKYVPYTDAIGAANAKNAVFANATGDYVMCLDSHVLLRPGTIQLLRDYYARNPYTRDLFTGPLLYDSLRETSTHFDPQWRGEMWGIWANNPDASSDYSLPFPIWGNGCGLFTCRRDAWLGFNEHFRGFGGEEGYIHEKFRKAGHEAICLPWLKWWHRFGRPDGVKYPLSRFNKVRNYILGHQELGLSLDPIHEHFVKSNLMSQAEWDFIMEDPVNHSRPEQFITAKQRPAPTIEDVYQAAAANSNSYFNQHMPKLRELASQCKTVGEITRTQESTKAILAAQPQRVTTITREIGSEYVAPLAAITPNTTVAIGSGNLTENVDMLFLKPIHEDHGIAKTLEANEALVNRWIVIHDIASGFYHRTSDGGPGYGPQVQRFLDEHPAWFVASHDPKQFGLTVLSRLEQDRPATPMRIWSEPVPAPAPIGFGPGTELKKMMSDLGVNPSAHCTCNSMSLQMDAWGVEGCRTNMEQIVAGITANQDGWGWREKMTVAFKVAAAGYFSIKSMVEEAIRRAEAKQQEGKAAT